MRAACASFASLLVIAGFTVCAFADSISAVSLEGLNNNLTVAAGDPPGKTLLFKCCNGAKSPVDDLEVTYSTDLRTASITMVEGCKGKIDEDTVVITCNAPITVGQEFVIDVTGVDAVPTFDSACWTSTGPTEVCAARASPVPEPPTFALIGTGVIAFSVRSLVRRSFRHAQRI
jgi:hypothetical protein